MVFVKIYKKGTNYINYNKFIYVDIYWNMYIFMYMYIYIYTLGYFNDVIINMIVKMRHKMFTSTYKIETLCLILMRQKK